MFGYLSVPSINQSEAINGRHDKLNVLEKAGKDEFCFLKVINEFLNYAGLEKM